MEMNPMRRMLASWRRLARVAMATRGLRVIFLAGRNYVLHQSANQAGSLAFSSLLAMFPLLILLSATAGYLGHSLRRGPVSVPRRR
ncbi:hypothetical protein WKW80_12020 [Variovorax humicola]|uniref:YihY/virulence factor BrkB family protein n=1 Tax=Variovorax humicola TaxID=1769758 RepID=A0ABU8VYP6_9BURK